MKINFEDKSYLEINKINDEKVLIIISAKDYNNPNKKITNSVEVDLKQIKDFILQL